MATSYPGSLDNFTNPTSTSPINSPSHADQHSNANDAIEAIEGELGTNPKGTKATVKARLDDVDTAIALKAPIASPTFTGTVTIPAGSAITGIPYLATANTFTSNQIINNNSSTTPVIVTRNATGQTANIAEFKNESGVSVARISTGGSYFSPSVLTAGSYSTTLGTITSIINSASTIGLVIRGAASQTANLTEWQDSTGGVLTAINSSGQIATFGRLTVGSSVISTDARMVLLNTGTTTSVLQIIRGIASQTGDLQQWQNSAGSVIAKVDCFGEIGSNIFMPVSGSGAYMALGASADTNSITVFANNAANKGLVVRAAASQTANLQEWQDSAGTVGFRVSASPQSIGFNATTTAKIQVGSVDTMIYNASTGWAFSPYDSAKIGMVVKGVASQTADLQQWQDSSGTTLTKVMSDGTLYVPIISNTNANAYIGWGTGGNPGFVVTGGAAVPLSHFRSGNASSTPIVAKGAASQTADLQQWQNSAGSVVASIANTGSLTTGNLTLGTNGLIIDASSASPYIAFGSNTITINTRNAAYKGLIVKGAASQTADLQLWQNSTGTVLAKIDANGVVSSSSGLNIGSASFSGVAWNGISNPSSVTTLPTLVIKGIASQTANLQEWRDSADAINASLSSTGDFRISNIYAITSFNNAQLNMLSTGARITTNVAANVTLTVKGATSQTADLQQWQDSAGTVLAGVNAARQIYAGTTASINGSTTTAITSAAFTSATVAVFTYGGTSLVQAGQRVTVAGVTGGTYNGTWTVTAVTSTTFTVLGSGFTDVAGTGGTFTLSAVGSFVASTAAITPIVVRAAASQTANLQEWQNSAGAILNSVLPTGGILLNRGNDSIGSQSLTQMTFGYLSSSSQGSYRHWISSRHNSSIGSGNALSFYTSDGTALGTFPTNGILGLVIENGAIESPKATIGISAAANIGLIIKGAASQTANLQEWQDSTGTVLASIAKNGDLTNNGIFTVYGRFGGASFTDAVALRVNGYNTSVPTAVIKGIASQTANLQEWQNSAGTVLSRIDSTGALRVDTNTVLNNTQTGGTTAYIKVNYANTIPLIVQGAASQSANLQEWQNSSGTLLAKIANNGRLTIKPIPFSGGVSGGIYLGDTSNAWVDGAFEIKVDNAGTPRFGFTAPNAATEALTINGTSVGVQTTSPSAVFQVTSNAAGNIASIIKGATSQTANLQEWQNSAGTVLAKVGNAGAITVGSGRVQLNGNNTASYFADGISSDGNYTGGGIVRGTTGGIFGGTTQLSSAGLTVYATAAGNPGAIIRGASSQSANLQEWQDSNGTTQAYVRYDGFINTNSSVRIAGDNLSVYRFQGVSDGNYTMNFPGSGNIQLFSATNDTGSGVGVLGIKNATTAPTSNPTTGGILYVSSGALLYRGTSNASQQIIGSDGSVKFTSPAASIVPLIIQHASSPSSSYFEIRNSAGNPVWGINSAGESLTRTTTKYGANIQNDSNNNNTALSLSAPSTSGSGIALYVYSGSTTRDMVKFDNSGVVKLTITSDGSLKGGNSNTISVNTASTVDTVALSSFTSMEYTLSIKQGSKIRSSKVLVHTDGTSVDSTEYGIMEMGGGITGILVTASVSSTNAILQVTITDAATTNATVKLIKTML